MNWAKFAFWICFFLVAYTYFIYPLVLFFAYALAQIRRDWKYLSGRRGRRATDAASVELPTVSLIVPAHNEAKALPQKLANLNTLSYPPQKLEVIFVSDGSEDDTNGILSRLSGETIRNVFLSERGGKSNALNHGVDRARNEILVFSDASTLFAPDAILKLVRHFSNPKIGVVCGALAFVATSESRQTEGLYWRYESILRLMEARLGATLTASGAIYAIRRECYRPLSKHTLVDDLVVPMNARRLGYDVVYDPEAAGSDFAAASVKDEFARRVRLAVGSFRALGELWRAPMPGFTRVAFFSHKLLRWVLPFLLVGVLFSNIFLLRGPLYSVIFVAQAGFYLLACIGFMFHERAETARYALVSYFLVAMNIAFLVGFFRFLRGPKEVGWQQVNRA
ncbi:MAG TPA: glycosyltransferase family 2 protein [Candidatus Dormibacteraeota bacterium]|nr:glycosyltransferase family 2 protein [Candidatus Dormibacteraeota bacterium]